MVPVNTPQGDRPHPGWPDAPDPAGWEHRCPQDLICPECTPRGTAAPLRLYSVFVVGGRYELIWRMVCPRCALHVDYPAKDNL